MLERAVGRAKQAVQSALAAEVRVTALESEHVSTVQVCRGEQLPAFIVSRNGLGAVHKVVTDFLLGPPCRWRAWCGWAYGDSAFERKMRAGAFPASRLCPKCYRV